MREQSQCRVLLQSLPAGATAAIVELNGCSSEVARLAEMGLRRGAVVRLCRGGISCVVQLVGGSRLCLRPSPDLNILVQPIG